MREESIQKDYITYVITYVSNIGEPRYLEQILTDLKGEKGTTH